ncbi:MAG: hypothetical protein JWR16_1621 [Nevskia sp.]|nr:hypothetical protein [Nevskia sp.]
MTDEVEASIDQRRKSLQDELAAQRALVAQRLAPKADAAAAPGERSALGVSAAYPRSMTLRLAQRHPALAIGLVALGASLLMRGRREELDGILSMAKAVEPLFSGADQPD